MNKILQILGLVSSIATINVANAAPVLIASGPAGSDLYLYWATCYDWQQVQYHDNFTINQYTYLPTSGFSHYYYYMNSGGAEDSYTDDAMFILHFGYSSGKEQWTDSDYGSRTVEGYVRLRNLGAVSRNYLVGSTLFETETLGAYKNPGQTKAMLQSGTLAGGQNKTLSWSTNHFINDGIFNVYLY